MISDAGVSPSGSTIQRHAQTWPGGHGPLAEYELALFVARQLVCALGGGRRVETIETRDAGDGCRHKAASECRELWGNRR
jgi:hypothetical protein